MSFNYVQQQENNTMIVMGEWRVGLWIDENGILEIYVDNDNGDVIQHGAPDTEDDSQWAGSFIYGIPADDYVRETMNEIAIRHSDGVRGNVRVEVTN